MKEVYLFSQCFGNSHSCVQIKSCYCCYFASAKLKYLNSYYYIFNLVLFVIRSEGSHFGYSESITISHQNSQTSEKIGADVSIFLGSSVLYWHIVKQSSIFVIASIFNLRFFLWAFSKTLIVDYVVFPQEIMTHYVWFFCMSVF